MTDSSPPPRSLPCARGHAFWGCQRELAADPLGLYARVQAEHGDVAAIRLLGGLFRVVLVASPDAVERVLSSNHRNYVKPPLFLSLVDPVFEGGVFTAEGPLWKRRRALLAPAFHPDRLLRMAPAIARAAEERLEAWEQRDPDAPVDLLEELHHLTLAVASRVFFGADLGDDGPRFGIALREALECLGQRLARGPGAPLWVPTPANLRLRRARKTLRQIIARLLAAQPEPDPSRDDLLTRLRLARDEDGRALDAHELTGELLTLLIAGHDTTAAALAWTWWLLATHPQVLGEVREEVDAVLGGRSPCAADLPKLPLTLAAFEEALRLYPPAWGQPRQSLEADVLDGVPLPPKTMVVASQWLVHRHPEHWDRPDTFDPSRFTPERVRARHRVAYFPFGAGPRLCIGRRLALMEGPLLLAALLDRFDVEPIGAPPRPDPTFTLRPLHGLPVRLIRRR